MADPLKEWEHSANWRKNMMEQWHPSKECHLEPGIPYAAKWSIEQKGKVKVFSDMQDSKRYHSMKSLQENSPSNPGYRKLWGPF